MTDDGARWYALCDLLRWPLWLAVTDCGAKEEDEQPHTVVMAHTLLLANSMWSDVKAGGMDAWLATCGRQPVLRDWGDPPDGTGNVVRDAAALLAKSTLA